MTCPSGQLNQWDFHWQEFYFYKTRPRSDRRYARFK